MAGRTFVYPRSDIQMRDYVYDSNGVCVGKAANILEQRLDNGIPTQTADVVAPPPAVVPPTCMDIGAFWYQDWGLYYTYSQVPSQAVWYDYRWNHRHTAGYQLQSGNPGYPGYQGYIKDRHPMLGWYHGDDANTIAWLTKWLVESGVNYVVNQQRATLPDDDGNWSDPTSVAHCWYQLMNNNGEVNRGTLKNIFWIPNTASTATAYGPHKGIWSSTTTYTIDQIVVIFVPDGSGGTNPAFYVALGTSTNAPPASTPASWKLIPTWNSATAYVTGDRVFFTSSGGPKFWIAVANSTNVSPSGNPASWQVTSDWNTTRDYAVGSVVVNTAFDSRQYVALQASGPGNGGSRQPNSNPTYWALVPMPAEWQSFVTFYQTYKNKMKAFNYNGKMYVGAFMWESETCRVTWGNGTFRNWLQDLGTAMKAAVPEWNGGAAILMRASPSPSVWKGQALSGQVNYDLALAGNALLLRTDYPGTQASTGATNSYQQLIDFFPTFSSAGQGEARDLRVYAVPTSINTCLPHATGAPYVGHTPDKFKEFLIKVRNETKDATKAFPSILIYNVAEWAEGGPALDANKKDGFGYLNALKDVATNKV